MSGLSSAEGTGVAGVCGSAAIDTRPSIGMPPLVMAEEPPRATRQSSGHLLKSGKSMGRCRPHPISLDSALPNGGMAMNHGGWDGEEADESQAWCGRDLGAEWAGGASGAVERAAEDRAGPAL